jgi:hypothetical protein
MIIFVVSVFGLLALSDFPAILRNKRKKETAVLSFLYLFVFTLAAMQVFGVILPSPIKGIEAFITNVLHLEYPK